MINTGGVLEAYLSGGYLKGKHENQSMSLPPLISLF